jgi:sodium/potassium-transporting ATPase subunit alpha
MSVVGIWLNDAFYSTGEMAQDQPLKEDLPNLKQIVQGCALCCKSKFSESESDKPLSERQILGDATEIGLLRFACKHVNAPLEQERCRKVFEIPFSSATKWHLTVHQSNDEPGHHYVALLKGAPERVARMCKYIKIGGELVPWNEEIEAKFNNAYEHFAVRGRRVLALARQPLPAERFPEGHLFSRDPCDVPIDEFIFTGLVAIMDPPKHGVRKAIAACRTAGIQIVMVTGDHPLTAEAIARQIGLISGETLIEASLRLKKAVQLVEEDEYDAVVVHGEKLDHLNDADWDRILSKKEIVFARTSPKQKLEIVTRFQNKGHIVGVSGDGVNDSPALKKADLGISMNKTASDVSKEAASMILLDDNFASIVNGVAEGRLIFANLKKSIRYTLTHLIPEVIAFVVFIVLAIPLPLNSLLVLLIDLGSELGPALSFAFEPPESDLMMVPPRKVLCQALPEADKDIEARIEPKPGFFRATWRRICKPFKRGGTGEVLVDSDLLFWAYCQGGIIETLGCFGAYFVVLALNHVPFDMLVGSAKTYWKEGAPLLRLTNGSLADATKQIAISGSSQSSYYAGIVICQLFNLWVTKHRYSYPYGWDMLQNRYTYIGGGIAIGVAAIVIYVPGLNDYVLGGGPVPVLALLVPIAAGIFLIFYEFGRRFLRRKGK